MGLINTVKATVLTDSKMVFLGEPIYRKGEVYYGVVDLDTDIAIITFKFGNQVVDARSVKDLALALIGDGDHEKDPKYKSISQYLKSITLNKWISEEVKDKYVVYTLHPSRNINIDNNVVGNGGSEFIMRDHTLLAVKHVSDNEDLMTQIRKGSIFYLKEDEVFIKEELELDTLSYEVLKEIRFIIENDYKYNK